MGAEAAARPAIRPMRPEDIAAVQLIEQQVYEQPWSASLFATELAEPNRCYLAAWAEEGAGGGLLGYGGVRLAVDEAHITNVAVAPRARRQKVGSHLVLALLEAAVDMGATAATLEVRTSNRAAQGLYASFGFASVGVRPRYYAADGEDAIIMWVHDLDGMACAALLRRRGAQLRPGPRASAHDASRANLTRDREVVS
ncbi:MAG TPA: ribosomal protein S18-alanine N-acetyltransferase [Euzebya sp.]|nr:ribosomal protein S18-alanine N-acetyltransferase [Euzebya sp.]